MTLADKIAKFIISKDFPVPLHGLMQLGRNKGYTKAQMLQAMRRIGHMKYINVVNRLGTFYYSNLPIFYDYAPMFEETMPMSEYYSSPKRKVPCPKIIPGVDDGDHPAFVDCDFSRYFLTPEEARELKEKIERDEEIELWK